MKQILGVYSFVALILLAVLSLLSYSSGAGYIYVLWRDIQIQTNIWVVVFFFLLLSFMVHSTWYLMKRYLNQERRKLENTFSFSRLHPYEQLGVVWLLEGESEKQEFIQEVFNQSGLLKNIIQARLLFRAQHYTEALTVLEQSSTAAFELAEIQRIKIYLAENQAQQALTHLEFLSGHELSPWLKQVSQAYAHKLQNLWGAFAIKFPFEYLHSTQFAALLNEETQRLWLTELLSKLETATAKENELIQQRYLLAAEHLTDLSYEIKVLWLKVLTHYPEMSQQHQNLALQLLNEKFDQDVFYLLFQHYLLRQNPDYEYIEQQIEYLETKYSGIPVFAFAKWHIYNATGKTQQAEQLLSLYPDDPLMNYLRIKSTLNGNDDLILQLNSIFENDANFVKFKI